MWAGCGCQTGGAAWHWSVPSAAQGKWLCGVKSHGTGNGVVVPCGARFPTLLNGEHPTLPQQLPTLVQYRRGRDCEAGSRVTERLRRGVRLCVIPAITRQDESFGVEASVPGGYLSGLQSVASLPASSLEPPAVLVAIGIICFQNRDEVGVMAGKNNHVVRSLHCLTVCVKSGEHVHSLLLLTPIADGAVPLIP